MPLRMKPHEAGRINPAQGWLHAGVIEIDALSPAQTE
jgi:hypothetical protein